MIECYMGECRKARREHECEFCKRKISKGKKYSYEKGKWEGEFFTRKLCIPCSNMLEEYLGDTGYDEFNWEDVEDFLTEEHCRNCAHSDNCIQIPQQCGDVIKIYKGEER